MCTAFFSLLTMLKHYFGEKDLQNHNNRHVKGNKGFYIILTTLSNILPFYIPFDILNKLGVNIRGMALYVENY